MVADDVIVEIDQEREYRELGAEVELQGGFLVGHLGRLTKADGSVLSQEDADEILSALHFFLSFSGGVKTGPVLPLGFRGGERVWELWSTPYVSSWAGGTMSWLPYTDLRAVGRAFDGFLHRWRSDAWEEVLRYAVHWHTTANAGAGAVDCVP